MEPDSQVTVAIPIETPRHTVVSQVSTLANCPKSKATDRSLSHAHTSDQPITNLSIIAVSDTADSAVRHLATIQRCTDVAMNNDNGFECAVWQRRLLVARPICGAEASFGSIARVASAQVMIGVGVGIGRRSRSIVLAPFLDLFLLIRLKR
jgi:hypothetical protein